MLPAYLQGQAFQHTDFRWHTCKVICVPSWFLALGKGTSFCLTNAPLNLLDNIAPTVLLMMQQRDWSFRGLTFILQQRERLSRLILWRHQCDTSLKCPSWTCLSSSAVKHPKRQQHPPSARLSMTQHPGWPQSSFGWLPLRRKQVPFAMKYSRGTDHSQHLWPCRVHLIDRCCSCL